MRIKLEIEEINLNSKLFLMNVDEFELKMTKISKVEDEDKKEKISCC